MEEIARQLRTARERLGLTLEEAERATRIRLHHLEALERGDFGALPSAVQARGFLKNYSEFLGLESDRILTEYAQSLRERRRGPRPASLAEPSTRPGIQVRSRRWGWLSADLLVAALISVAVLGVLVWGGSRLMAGLRERNAALQEASGFLLPTATPSPPSEPAPTGEILPAAPELVAVTETPGAPLFTGAPDQIDLRLVIERRAWVRVLVDGAVEVQGRLAPGEVHDFRARQAIEVVTGNAGGVRVVYEGMDQGLLGEMHQVVIRLWTREGPITPTPSASPPVTETPVAPTGAP